MSTLVIPLEFYYSRETKSPQEIITSYPNIDYIHKSLHELDGNNDQDELSKLKDEIYDLQIHYARKAGQTTSYGLGIRIYQNDLKLVNDRIKQLSKSKYYDSNVKMSENEKVNEYDLKNVSTNFLQEDAFNSLWKLFKINDFNMTWETFYDKFDDIACSDWSKQDRHGTCYGGFWKYPEESYEYENAYSLSRKDNAKGLFELPFSREFLLETIRVGCNNRQESVKYSNLLGVYMNRKRKLMKLYTDKEHKAAITIQNTYRNWIERNLRPHGNLYNEAKEHFKSLC
jgi:hypothetical protein